MALIRHSRVWNYHPTKELRMNLSSSEKLQIDISEHTALLTIDNPPANTWDRESLVALKSLINSLDGDMNIYSLVLTGKGEKFMSAGADLKMATGCSKDEAWDMATHFGEAFGALASFRGVSVAAINGYAMGGGLECSMACDTRICADSATLALPEAAVGLLPCAGGTHMLKKLVGEAWAKRMILCGERVDAPSALRIGLVDEVVPREEVVKRALALAKQVARQSPVSVAACKSLIANSDATLTTALANERQAYTDLFDTQDQAEGVQAFFDKREPQWKNE